MKTENTLENKAKYFAQYWGQKVLKQDEILHVMPSYLSFELVRSHFLELKAPSSITDEDANSITIYGIYAKENKGFNSFGFDTPQGFVFYAQSSVDYLRSKGYALPFMGLSVEKLIEYGWLKLKEA